jgi:hypothetical protein
MIVDGELYIEVDADAIAPERAAKELLAIGADYAGVRHAIYPTACRTLCSMSDDKLVDVCGGGDGPDCLVCATAAAAFDRIDRSAPASWFRPAVAA